MDKPLFSIACTTCQARLSVRSEAAIGAILSCPKCGSMVQVVPPPDWKPGAGVKPEPEAPKTETREIKRGPSPVVPPPLAGEQPVSSGPPPVVGLDAGIEIDSPDLDAMPVSPAGEPPEPALWRRGLLLGAVPLVGVVVIAGVLAMVSSRRVPEPKPVPASEPAVPVSAPVEKPEAKEPEKPGAVDAARLMRRWLPEDTRLLVDLQLARLVGREESEPLLTLADPVWSRSAAPLLKVFGLPPRAVSRLTWATTNLADWANQRVVVIQLDAQQDAGILRSLGEPVALQLGETSCRRLKAGWKHPFAVLDAQTIVTGSEDLLRQLAGGEKKLKCGAIERFLEGANPKSDLVAVVDLQAASEARWRLPAALMDVWPAGRKAWHSIWESPRAIGVAAVGSDQATGEAAFVCEGETAADQLQGAIKELLSVAKPAVEARLQATGATSAPYASLLKQASMMLATARCQVSESVVWVRVDCQDSLAGLAKAVDESRLGMKNDWNQAAMAANEFTTRQLLDGLREYQRAEGRYPRGALGGVLLPPETRLSWIAGLLPYYGHRDWYGELQQGYSWNSSQNRSIASRPLEPVINPALGPQSTEAGFPVTHYVGLAGVGKDAAELKAGDPRAGMFGYNRATRPQDIADGASNTIAMVGVTQHLGPWASGGKATVRALTERPYVNGPDGFGSGQPDGMLVGMADGAVRFVSKDVDPTVLEQLATAGGKEQATVALLGPKSVPEAQPEPKTPNPEAPAKQESEEAKKPAEELAAEAAAEAEAHKREAAANAEVERRLSASVPAITLPSVSLRDALKLVSQLSGVLITLDLDALDALGISVDEPVNVKLSKVTLAGALERIVSSHGLAYSVERGQILVTSEPKTGGQLKPFHYNVPDLIGTDGDGARALVAMIQKLVAADSWEAAGGRGTIKADGEALAVVQTALVHEQIVKFCEKLRLARGRPLRSQHGAGTFDLTTKSTQARTKLDQPVTVNFVDPAPVARIAAELERASRMRIAINWLALDAAGISPEVSGMVKMHDQPLSDALDALRPLGLAYRVVNADTLEITTAKAVSAHLELEFYPVKKLVTEHGLAGPAIVERVTAEVEPTSWSEADGVGVVVFDEPSACLLVLQSQPVQTLVEAMLARWEAEKQ